MQISLPDLPYSHDALAPHISADTMETHHGKHHRGYVEKANNLIRGTAYENRPLEDIIVASKKAGDTAIFNNTAQAWNHSFFWQSLRPGGGGKPQGAIAERITKDLGGYDQFRDSFKQAGANQFGSGWAWLVLDGGQVKILSTHDADNPLLQGQVPLLTVDVWEHAYYHDHKNTRPDFLETVIDNLLNWDFANENLAAAKAG